MASNVSSKIETESCVKRRSVAIFTLILLLIDTGSDIYVAIDLALRCHILYAVSVVSMTLSPGFVFGWAQYFNGVNKSKIRAFLCPIWFIPYAIWKVGQAAFAKSDEPSDVDTHSEAKRYLWYLIFLDIYT